MTALLTHDAQTSRREYRNSAIAGLNTSGLRGCRADSIELTREAIQAEMGKDNPDVLRLARELSEFTYEERPQSDAQVYRVMQVGLRSVVDGLSADVLVFLEKNQLLERREKLMAEFQTNAENTDPSSPDSFKKHRVFVEELSSIVDEMGYEGSPMRTEEVITDVMTAHAHRIQEDFATVYEDYLGNMKKELGLSDTMADKISRCCQSQAGRRIGDSQPQAEESAPAPILNQ